MNRLIFVLVSIAIIISCTTEKKPAQDFKYFSEQFADLRVLRYQIPGFNDLPLQKKKLLYYLYQAGLSGREITYDQNFKYNLVIKRTLEDIVKSYTGDRETDDFKAFMVYTKRVWFSSGIHHHYSMDKFVPGFSEEYFTQLVENSNEAELPLDEGQTKEELLDLIVPIMFDPSIAPKRVNLDPNVDMVTQSANNYYEGVSQQEVEAYYSKISDKKTDQPISYGLNSKLVKENGMIREKVWKVGGMYTEAIERIVFWLEKAIDVSEDDNQKNALTKLVEYYKTGDLSLFDEYSIAWVKDTTSMVYDVNGFIETYGDALGYRGAYESIASFVDPVATKRIAAIGNQAQWFEDHSPIMDAHKKANVTGISANVITVVGEAGDAAPSTPIGINLPNANWIRATYGSRSVSLGNVIDAYAEASKSSGMLEEFGYSEEQNELERKYGALADNLHTDLHEVIGHASGKINPGVGTPKETLKNYASTLEEARADLVALYYAIDPKLVEIGVMPNVDVGKAEYISYIRNGLLWQLRRIELGKDIEESHMRNRQLISKRAYEMGKKDNVIEKVVRDGKTFFVINDFQKLRKLFGQLLREVQRIKSEGDYEAADKLVQTYGVKVDYDLHKEVLERYAKLHSAPYSGFINPRLVAVENNGEITDVKLEYPEDFTGQMMEYAEKYAFLPNIN